VLNFIGHKRNAKQNYTKISSHTTKNDHLQEQTTTNVGEDVGNRNPYTLLVGMQIKTTKMEGSMEFP
jgi:hypothetical protein